ncbi:MAG TPA: biopolymer transporter ExbD [Bdellovibrionales bacterium]|nr:biopolymer transporter ExbD [Pseudobdellovibrionaceae bacterium]HAG92035.1 biopolymer transporter ExbD [Bdellovibrionales bacterium]|tara:strand:- start:182 stop:592 length:411 start_codon:yes stop_codon:yes gene_type:complete
MAAKITGDTDEAIAEINIVPFVDIILVILIIFMVTAPVILKPSINVNLPKAGSGDNTSPSELTIGIDAQGGITLNGKPSSKEEVKSFTEELVSKSPDAQAIISADKEVSHGTVISVIDTVKSSGVKKFAITIDKKK